MAVFSEQLPSPQISAFIGYADRVNDSMNPVIDTKITYADRVDYASHANVKDGNSMVVRSSLEITQSLNDNAELNKGLGEKLFGPLSQIDEVVLHQITSNKFMSSVK